MLSMSFGFSIIAFGLLATIFADPFWGLAAFALFTHITPQQLSELYIVPLRAPFFISIAVLICYFFNSRYSQKFSERPAELWMMVIILLGMALGAAGAFDKEAAWSATLVFLKYVVFFFLFINIIDSYKKLTWFHNALILSAAWLVYRCWDQRGSTSNRFENRGGGVIDDSNEFAAALVLLLPLVVTRIFRGPWWIRAGAAAGTFGMIMSVVITSSRGGFLGLVAVYVATMTMFQKQRKKMLIILVGIALGASVFVTDYYKDRMLGMLAAQEGQVDPDRSAQTRFDAWRYALVLFSENPIYGCGMDNFGDYFGHEKQGRELGQGGTVCHSLWFQALSEGGLMVFVPLVAMLALFFVRTSRAKKSFLLLSREDVRDDIAALQVGLIGFLVAATFVNRLFYEPIYWWCGMAVVYSRIAQFETMEQDAIAQDAITEGVITEGVITQGAIT